MLSVLMPSVFASPSPTLRRSLPPSEQAVKKRKRRERGDPAGHSSDGESLHEPSHAEEYTAVLTPEERSQRRVAGHSLVKDLPPYPFPHKAPILTASPRGQAPQENHQADTESLRYQHVSAMSALLHRSLLEKDYARARRALGLVLRTDIRGKHLDIRAAGNWAIGAEILFRQYERRSTEADTVFDRHERRRRGFQEAKELYEKLIVQYPFHKPYPDSVSAVDFYLAIFSLWIYVAQAEGADLPRTDQMDLDELSAMDESLQRKEVKIRELAQAKEIAARMDRCMVSVPYGDNKDLLRLRAMVAEWQADLYDDCYDIPASEGDTQPEDPPASIEARKTAERIHQRLEGLDSTLLTKSKTPVR